MLCRADTGGSAMNRHALVVSAGTKLKNADFPNQNLTDDDVVQLCAQLIGSQKTAELSVMSLRGNLITDSGAAHLAELIAHAPALRVLNLSSNRVGDAGLSAVLSAALASQSLTALNLKDNASALPAEQARELEEALARNRAAVQGQKRAAAAAFKANAARPAAAAAGGGGGNCPKRAAAYAACLQDVHIAIVGGGIGGLALAIALRRRGVQCTVYERDSSFDVRPQGAGV
jgi:hypothetical protein